jgi:membrane peptidoglycan carboxypeptidase
MMRLTVFLLVVLLPVSAAAQSGLSEKSLTRLQGIADQIAAAEPGAVPKILVAAIIAAEASDHLRREPAASRLTLQLAGMHLGSMSSLQREAAEGALAGYLGERMTATEIAEAYASMVYFGRNCYGYRNAVQGLARSTAERADDATWLALAALPRSPSFYLRDRSALKDRVSRIIADMQVAGLVDGARAERLKSLPLASVDTGPGCSS